MSNNGTWQIEEGGAFVPRTSKHPWENRSFWRNKLRVYCLQRHPVCQICKRAASSHVDHIIPFISADGRVSWTLFADTNNHRALCASCHDRATATYDGGFGNERKAGKTDYVVPTGEAGRQFTSGTIGSKELDAALGTPEELAALLEGIE